MSPLAAQNWELLFQMLFLAVCAIPLGLVFYRLDRSVRRRGHREQIRPLIFFFGFLAALAAGIVNDSRDQEACYSCTAAGNPEYYRDALIWQHTRRFILNFVPGALVVTAVFAVVARLTPAQARTAGARTSRISWRLLANASIGVWLLGAPTLFLQDLGALQQSNLQWGLFVVCWSGYGIFAYRARRAEAPSLSAALLDDHRAPVFYLRPFDQEEEGFTTVSPDQLKELGIPNQTPQAFRHGVTLEEFFAASIRRHVGPFVALGDPHDSFPPGGASRDYIQDDTWQPRFQSLAHRSVFFIMGAGASANLCWELNYIRTAGLQTKLFVVTAPVMPRFFDLLLMRRRPSGRWDAFAEQARAAGLRLSEFPGRGAVISFDENGDVALVRVGAAKPEEYLEEILAYLRLDGTS